MFFETPSIVAQGLGKTFELYARPIDRLRQLLWGKRRHFSKSFVALDDVSFSLKKGEVLGLVGRNGAGKSTLLQLICGTLQPTAGAVTVNGRVAALLELGAGFNPEFTGRENVFLNAAVMGLSTAEIDARYDEIVNFSGIGDFIDQPVKTYSSGMYVRLAFAVATAVDPDILVIDEALSVGDGAFARKSFDRIMALKERGATILFCSHSMYHIEAICDTALWLDHGRMMLLDTPGRVVKAYTAQQNEDAATAEPASNLASSPLTAGQGRILEVVATVDGISGRKFKVTPGRSDLTIVVDFQIDASLPAPSIAFGLDTVSGVSVSSGSTRFDGQVPKMAADGRGQVTLRFPALPLMRGEYRLTIFLACERVIHVYDHALYCVELEVIHPGIEQGVVFLPHAWNDEPAVCAP
ncbi:MAG: ABC transporter ATP-binding protein [Rhodocyclaceae bacterium]|nr:ABC transporter ATP-binding protein [Rhodocyclaceae bacterium]